MYRVKNRRVLNRIADKTRKAAKERNLIAVFAIALTTVLFTSVFTIGGSIAAKQQEATMRQIGGSAHAGYKYLTREEYERVKKDKKIREISCRIAVGDAVNQELLKLRTEVGYYEELDAKWSFCYPETGRMPVEEDEIATSDLVLKKLGIRCVLGAEVPLEIKIGTDTVRKTFTLCGYFRGDSIAQSQIALVSKQYVDKAVPAPAESAMETGIDASGYAGRIMADFNFASGFRLRKQVEELSRRCGFPENTNVGINWAYLGGQMDTGTLLLALAMLAVILVSGYLIIYNIFYINVYHDIRYYGLLKTIGTTERQLRKIVRRQAYMLSAFGIFIGLILGILVGKILLPVVMSTLAFGGTTDTEAELNVWIFAGSAAFSFVTVLLSCIRPCRIASRVSEVEAVRYTEGQNEKQVKRQKKTKKIKRVSLREMALQNIKRDRKKVIIVVGSLSLALVILNSVYSLVRGFDMDKFVASRIVSDFSVADATLDNPSVDGRAVVKDGVTEEFQKELQKREGVEETGNIYMEQREQSFTDESWQLFEERIFGNERARKTLEWKAGSEDTELIERFREAKHIDGKLYGIGKMVMGKLENTEGTPDWEKFSSGDYVIVTGFETLEEESIDFFLPGEKVTITDRDGKVHEYEVLAAADLPYSCKFRNYGMFDCNYILPEDEFLNLVGEQGAMRTIFDVKEGYEAETEEWLADYCESVNPDLCYTSKSTIVKEFEQLKRTYAAAGSFMTLVLAVIGILNFINTMVTSVLSGKREFAMLEAVGMSGTQLRRMLCWEGGYYTVFTGICALALSSMFSLSVLRKIGGNLFFFHWHFTVMPAALCIPILGVVAYAVPVLCYRNMSRESVVERMRRA